VKAFYVRDLLYELNECSTWFEKEDFARALRTCLSDSHDPHCWSVPSVSMMSHFQQYALAAQNSESGQPLGEPDSHLWYLAIKKDFE